jgi:sarcosine oxidase subunit alpha
MRIEKGHVAGNEINGQTVARDLGLGKMMSQKKDYIGRSMAQRPALVAPERPTLAGFVAVDPKQRFGGGAHLLAPGAAVAPQNDLGFITSVAFSPSLDRWIGLGLIANAGERLGQQVRGYDPMRERDTLLEVVSPVFLDPEGARLHA